MTNKAKIVLKGFLDLSESEKEDFLNELKKYLNKDRIEKGLMNEQLGDEVRRILGPTSSDNCPCCGR